MSLFHKRRGVIALLTDFGLEDGYVGTMKGVIAGINPEAQILDLCHDVAPQDIAEGAFILYSAYKYLPARTVFATVVDPGVGAQRKVICVRTSRYTFLAPDNGILTLVLSKERPLLMVEVTNTRYFLPEVSSTFHGRDIFAPVAAHLSLGLDPSRLGRPLEKLTEIALPRPASTPGGMTTGEVIHIDRFGNLITNVNHEFARAPILSVTIGHKEIDRLSRTYQEGRRGEILALFGSSGHLEIAVNHGSAKETLNCSKGTKVLVKYRP